MIFKTGDRVKRIGDEDLGPWEIIDTHEYSDLYGDTQIEFVIELESNGDVRDICPAREIKTYKEPVKHGWVSFHN